MNLEAADARIREDWANITSIVVLREGDTVWERYYPSPGVRRPGDQRGGPCDEITRFWVASVTKSVLSAVLK